jgi:hypothetical protein
MWRRAPRQRLVISIAGALLVHGIGGGDSRAEETRCSNPTFISAFAAVHHHPSVVIAFYERNTDASSPVHDIVALVTPEKGLGIVSAEGPPGQSDHPKRYRAIHVHDRYGVLHVENDGATGYRLCDLFKLWGSEPRARETIDGIIASRMVHVRIGDQYRKNVSIEDVLRIPLNHDLPIIIFVEKKRPL